MIHWDPTISLGTLLSIVFTITAILVSIYKVMRHLDRIEFKVDQMWEWYKATVANVAIKLEDYQRFNKK